MTMIAPFVHLRLHTEYSLVDGLVRIKSLVKQVAAGGMPAVAVTDMSNLFALIKFYKAALGAGVKPIIGVETWVQRSGGEPFRLVLLCQNLEGYRHLTRLVSRGYLEGQQRGVPILDHDWLKGNTAGLIALSGGRDGEVGQALLNDHPDQARAWLADWRQLFPERFYLEVQRTGRPWEEEYLEAVVDLAAESHTPVVATNDVCFLQREDFEAHEARVCIHDGMILGDMNRPRRYSDQQYLRTPAEMVELFADLPEALENSVEIARRCNLCLELGKNVLPDFPIPEGMSAADYFTVQARAGLEQRLRKLLDAEAADFAARRQPYDERLELELKVIIQMGFPGYFLIVADFIQWARNHGVPVGPGRGSGAGSLVAYSLGITDLDPLAYELLFERFLNPERVSMPDFDIDFCMEGRDRVIEYVAQRYGRERVSQIATHGSMAAKAVVRDVGRVLGHPYGFVDRIAKLIPFELGITLDKAIEQEAELRRLYENDEEVRTLIELARKLEGLARNVGKHAGGVVIAPVNLTDYSPLYCEQDDSGIITQFDKDDVEAAGLVKFDFLGLRTLTIIDWALQTVNAQRQARDEPPLDIADIALNDAPTFALLKRYETTAVFQLESSGMKDLIRRLQPDCFEDIVALVALFRPGPLQSGMVDDFIDRKHGRARIEYPHPALEPILKPTYGVILYQEQVMQIAQVLAGYSLGGADILRRCLSGNTEVVDVATGQRVMLCDMANNPGFWIGREVLALDQYSQKIVPHPIEAIYKNGIQDIWEITTKTGRHIRATAQHLFYTLLGWKPLSEFRTGDRIGLAGILPIKNSSNISDAQIKLIAYLLGDGHLCTKERSHCYFCNSDPELIADFNTCASELFGRPAPVSYQLHPGRKTVGYVRVGSISSFNIWVDFHVKRAHSREKEIPDWVFLLSNDQLKLFLGTLWSTDGSFDMAIGHTDYTSTSRAMIEQIQHLLLRLGIVSLFNIKTTQYNGKNHISYRAQVTGREEVLKFCKKIQPFLSRKKFEKAQICYSVVYDKLCNQSKHTIPHEVIGLIANAKYASGMTWAEIDHAVGARRGTMSSGLNFQNHSRHSLSRHRVRNFATALDNQQLRAIAESDVFWDVVKSIEFIGKEEVFDLTIPQNHNFIANDFIAHNCMGKKKPEEMAQQRDIFLKGSLDQQVNPETSSYIFDLMEKFAGYGFNRSHSAAYALVSYQTLWLKTHYPAAFMAAVLSSDMDKTEKVVVLIEECRRMGLPLAPPAINASEYRFTAGENGEIRYGLGAIKGVGEGAIEALVSERRQGGAYRDLFDLCQRVDLRKLNRRVLESLIRCGALDDLGANRATLAAQMPEALQLAEQHLRNSAAGQNDMFGLATADKTPIRPLHLAKKPEWTQEERLRGEKETLGLYLSGHPLDCLAEELTALGVARLSHLTGSNGALRRGNDRSLLIAGLVVSVRTRNANRGGRMAFVTLDDGSGQMEIRIFPEVYEQHRSLIVEDAILLAQGALSWDEFNQAMRLNVERVLDWDGARVEYARRLLLRLDAAQCAAGALRQLASLLAEHRAGGRCAVWIEYTGPQARVELVLGQNWRVKPSDALLKRLRELAGGEGQVTVLYDRSPAMQHTAS
jgi:DNA polymerase-3 subunit alpha